MQAYVVHLDAKPRPAVIVLEGVYGFDSEIKRIVIASRTGGLKAIIDHGRSGFHFTPRDTEDLARVLAHVIKGETSLASIRRAARAEASNYSWDVVASATAALLTRIL